MSNMFSSQEELLHASVVAVAAEDNSGQEEYRLIITVAQTVVVLCVRRMGIGRTRVSTRKVDQAIVIVAVTRITLCVIVPKEDDSQDRNSAQ